MFTCVYEFARFGEVYYIKNMQLHVKDTFLWVLFH